MALWNKICCAVDFSEPSRLAMEDAAALAKQLGAELTLLHVHELPTAATTGMLVSPPELFAAAVTEVEHKLEVWRVEAEQLACRPVRMKVVPGAAAAEIGRFATEEGMDAIVVATHGRTGLRRLLIGSVAERVVAQADCPVVVIRHPVNRIEPD